MVEAGGDAGRDGPGSPGGGTAGLAGWAEPPSGAVGTGLGITLLACIGAGLAWKSDGNVGCEVGFGWVRVTFVA